MRLMTTTLLLAAFSLVGCGPRGPHLAEVTGIVRLDGEPLPGAQLTFVPAEPGGSTAYGHSDEDGFYRLKFSRDSTGALPGTYKVVVELPNRGEAEALRASGITVPPEGVKLPKKYQKPGELTVEVDSRGSIIDLNLTSG